ncbi:MAG TPA: hypothetical protein VGN97_21795 [Mesorhizobium sp.]|jgi:hypothetical protein|nr:hypothetical protein [Mesorhizobium sp.]
MKQELSRVDRYLPKTLLTGAGRLRSGAAEVARQMPARLDLARVETLVGGCKLYTLRQMLAGNRPRSNTTF